MYKSALWHSEVVPKQKQEIHSDGELARSLNCPGPHTETLVRLTTKTVSGVANVLPNEFIPSQL